MHRPVLGVLLVCVTTLLAACSADVSMHMEHVATYDKRPFVELQGALVNGEESAIATQGTVYVITADGCTPQVSQVVPLPPLLQDPKLIIMQPGSGSITLWVLPRNDPDCEHDNMCNDELRCYEHSYSRGGFVENKSNLIDLYEVSGYNGPAWTGLQVIDSQHVVMVSPVKLVTIAFNDGVSVVNMGYGLDAESGLEFTSDPVMSTAVTGAAGGNLVAGALASQKTEAAMMVVLTMPPLKRLVSFYTTPPQLLLSNSGGGPNGLHEFWWLQHVKESGESAVLHWISENGSWFGPNADDSLRTASADTSGGAWGPSGKFFTASPGTYSPAAMALAFSGDKTSTRAHVFQFVPTSSSSFDIETSLTQDLPSPLIRVANDWPQGQCSNAVLVGMRAANGHAQPTVLALSESDTARFTDFTMPETTVPRGVFGVGHDTEWCYADEQCQCPDSPRGQPPCGPTLCCETWASQCWQVGDKAVAMTVNCCPEPPVTNCRAVKTPCT